MRGWCGHSGSNRGHQLGRLGFTTKLCPRGKDEHHYGVDALGQVVIPSLERQIERFGNDDSLMLYR